MLFSSILFLFYFLPVVLVLYYLLFFSRTLQNLLLVVASLIFYAWAGPKYIILILGSTFANYLFAILIEKNRSHKGQMRTYMIMMLAANLGLLFIFKYLSFVTANLNYLTGGKIDVLTIALPIGISFYTFKGISYVIDVYRKNAKVQYNIFNLMLYISFFPQLIAGPIVRYTAIEKQIKDRQETITKFSAGICMLITGLGKKVLISNNMALVTDNIFNLAKMGSIPSSLAWLGAIAYTLQIYFDFSGYSDMAIGLGLMFGFKFGRNFNYPYISKSISEFWRRWHISLGQWFRDYVYIPLGGSRVRNKDIVVKNLAVVWILTGVWHGANWTFLIWGIINFIFIAFEKVAEFDKLKIPAWVRHIYTMLIVIIGWVLFRSDSILEAGRYIGYMFNFISNGFFSNYTFMFLKEYGIFFIAAILFSMPIASMANQVMAKGIRIRQYVEKDPPYDSHAVYEKPPLTGFLSFLYPFGIVILFLICIIYMVKGSYNPFIYFQF